MSDTKPTMEIIVNLLNEKVSVKQDVYITKLEIFQKVKKILKEIHDDLYKKLKETKTELELLYEDKGPFEVDLTFGGDILVVSMHTNIFTFDEEHFLHRSNYVKEDPSRAYCGILKMYNFLKDSIKYKRNDDIGYLIGRIFVNKDEHFFVEGRRQLGFLYNDFETSKIDDNSVRKILESAIIYCLDFDLLTPPYNTVNEMTVSEKLRITGIGDLKTGKRLGFRFSAERDKM